ncbi:MAG: DUF4440 domain-containing protein [Saprospiraceae bacterium]|nr:DUF4440 domain-containing protein [Saprospiraceae bacterium]
MKTKNVFMMLAVITFILPCKSQTTEQIKEEKNLMELSRAWAKTVQNGNTNQIVSYWSEDAVLMTPDQGKIEGRQNLAAMVESSTQIPGFEIGWEPKSAHVAKSGDLGYVIAHKYVKVPDQTGNLNTIYFIEVGIWEKQEDGSWKNTVDIYNPDPSINSINN